MILKREIATFLVIGIINTIVGLSSIFILFHIIGFNYWLATFLGNGLAMILSYFLNRTFTFQSKTKITITLIKFLLVVLACYYLSYWSSLKLSNLILLYFTMLSKFSGDISILMGSVLYTLTNFFGQKYIVFQKVKDKNQLRQIV